MKKKWMNFGLLCEKLFCYMNRTCLSYILMHCDVSLFWSSRMYYFKNKICILTTYDFTLNDLIQNNAITNLKFFHDKKKNKIIKCKSECYSVSIKFFFFFSLIFSYTDYIIIIKY
jgi:hypothetical protein